MSLQDPLKDRLVLFHDDGLTVYDPLSAGTTTRQRVSVPGVAPAGFFTADGRHLVVSLGESGEFGVLETKAFRTVRVHSANVEGARDSFLVDLAPSIDGRLVFAADVANQDIVAFDWASGKVLSRTKAGRQPYALALSEDGEDLYVANIGTFDYSLVPKPREGEGDPRGLTRPAFAYPTRESEEGVEAEGRFVPGLGVPVSPDGHSVWRFRVGASGELAVQNKANTGLLIHAPADGGKSVGGSSPCALEVFGKNLYVSNANNDTVQEFDSRTLKLKRTFRLSPSALVASLRGVIPTGMAVDRKRNRLYVCEGGLNAVGVIDLRSGRVLGHLPTGWFPVQVRLSADGKKLFVSTQKGLGRGPLGHLDRRPQSDERYGMVDMPGMVDATPVPTDAELKDLTEQVLENNGIVNRFDPDQVGRRPIPYLHGNPSQEIRHVVFITKENHTFDGIFGALERAKGRPEYAEFGQNGWIAEKGKTERVPIMPNHIALARQFSISENFYMEPQASGDGHRWLVGAYPSLWSTRVFYSGWGFRANDEAKGRLASMGSNGSAIPEDYLENGSLWDHLVRGGITFRNYGEGYEFPGSQEPSDTPGQTGTLLLVNHPMGKPLWDNTCWTYPMYNTDIPDIARVEWFIRDLEQNYISQKKPLPQYLNITLCNDHGAAAKPNEGYPYVCSYMADNDLALGRLVEYLTHLPEWKNMAILVTEDDPGADNDHVDRHRSFVLAISPYSKRGHISREHTSIMSCLKTIYLVLGLGPNNLFDAVATDLADMFTEKPDFTPYKHLQADPRVFVAEKAYNPADPKFQQRIWDRPKVALDDPNFVDWLRNRTD